MPLIRPNLYLVSTPHLINDSIAIWKNRKKNVKGFPAKLFKGFLQCTWSNHQLSVLMPNSLNPLETSQIPKHWNLNYWQADLLLYSTLLALRYQSISHFTVQLGIVILDNNLKILHSICPLLVVIMVRITFSVIILWVSYLLLDSTFFFTNIPFGWFLLFHVTPLFYTGGHISIQRIVCVDQIYI